MPRLYIALPLVFLLSFSLAIVKSFVLTAENSKFSKFFLKPCTLVVMIAIALACIATALFILVLTTNKRKEYSIVEKLTNGLKLLGFLASIIGCVELCLLLTDVFPSGDGDKYKQIDKLLSKSSSFCFVIATVLLTIGMFLDAYTRKEEKSRKSALQVLNDYKYAILFLCQVIGAGGFLIQSYYPSQSTTGFSTKGGIHSNAVAVGFLCLGAISAMGLLFCGYSDYKKGKANPESPDASKPSKAGRG